MTGLQRMGRRTQEAEVAYFKLLQRSLPGGTKEDHASIHSCYRPSPAHEIATSRMFIKTEISTVMDSGT